MSDGGGEWLSWPDEETSVDDAPRPPRRRRRRPFAVFAKLRGRGVPLVLAGTLLTGAVGGWFLNEWLRPAGGDVVLVNRPVVEEAAAAAAGTMPNLAGLTEAQARQALFSVGVKGEILAVVSRPAAGQSGIVIEQRPAPGEKTGNSVTVVLSAPAVVPKVVGLDGSKARDQFAALGAGVIVAREYRDGASEGTVLAVSPAEGSPLTDRVTLTLASAPSSVFLSKLRAADSDCSSGSETTNAKDYPNSIVCTTYATATATPRVVEYVANKKLSSLEFAFGQSDRSPTGQVATVRVFADDRALPAQQVAFGEAKPLKFDIRGVLRVRIEVTVSGPKTDAVRVVLGDARFVGSPDAIDALADSSN